MSLLEIRDLKKSYLSPEGERGFVIDVPTFDLAAGEQAALRGSSGSGKTTFLNLIAGILKADAGRIVVDGHVVTSLSEARRDEYRAKTVSYVFQTFNLLQGYTAIENVLLGMMFGPGPDLAFAKSLLGRVGLPDRMNYRPPQLSVGQQQRVALARALANKPRLILADEPTGNLDHVRAREALAMLRGACQEYGASLLLVSHDREVLSAFDRVEELSTVNLAGRRLPEPEGQEAKR